MTTDPNSETASEHAAKPKLRFLAAIFVILVLPLSVLTVTWYGMRIVSQVEPSTALFTNPGERIPDFNGVSQWGDTLNLEFVEERVTLVTFFDAECGLTCIDGLLRVEEIEHALNKYKEFRILSLCIDPSKADPARIQLLRQRLGTDSFWHLLAPDDSLSSLGAARLAGFDPTDAENTFGRTMLLDREGRVRGRYDILTERGIQDAVNDAVYLLAHADD